MAQKSTAKVAGSICVCTYFGLWLVAFYSKMIVAGSIRLSLGIQMLLLGGIFLTSFLVFAFAMSKGEWLRLLAWFVLLFGVLILSLPLWAVPVFI